MIASDDVKLQWRELRRENPTARARDAAQKWGIAEAEIVASMCGEEVVRLDSDWTALFQALPSFGRVMALTRNDWAVHERMGVANPPEFFGAKMGQVVGEDIDLRLFPSHWQHGFALREETKQGIRRSLQIFDADGTAVHKVYVQPAGNADAYEAFVENHAAADQSTAVQIAPPPAETVLDFASQVDLAEFRAAWDAMKDTHEFFAMLRRFRVSRWDGLTLAGPERAHRVANSSLRQTLNDAAARGLPIMVFVGNAGILQIHTGPVANVQVIGPWLNVMDEHFNLHVREDLIVESWVVRKPTKDGIVTSLELFAAGGKEIALLFGKRKPGQLELDAWRELVRRLPAP